MRYLLIIVAFVLGLGACAQKTPDQYKSDKPLYDYAMAQYKKGNHTEAITYFESLRNRFPRSRYLIDSEMKIAESYFKRREYLEAETSYRLFRTLHPTNEQIPYVVFMIGMTHYKRIPGSVARDQIHTEKALQTFKELLAKWPRYKEAKKTKEYILKCKKALDGREMYVADYYLKQKKYDAALVRLKPLRNSSDFDEIQTEAGYKMGYAYYKLKDPKLAKDVLSPIAKNPKAGKYQSKAKKLLGKVGS